MQRLALITACEALEMAGLVLNRTPSTNLDRIGTFYGQTSDDWCEINAAQEIDTNFKVELWRSVRYMSFFPGYYSIYLSALSALLIWLLFD